MAAQSRQIDETSGNGGYDLFKKDTSENFSSCPAIFVHGRNDENFGMKIYYDF
jgi:hypothetical protein